MSIPNFLSVKSHLSELKSASDKDTLSEASETGTTNSTNSEDLQKLALILGVSSGEDVYQERFRVDRRRLECMLADNLQESQTANGFFNQVMHDTGTVINWPARLKIGARSKKDPHVRVAGRRSEDVKMARERIMQLLDTRSNRVTMKVDVSYTDHSHIIGKGGLTIKRVMEETGCHIHFPDSNRSNSQEKSNQVSIAGDMERVEKARARVRALTPLIFSFELPIMSASKPVPDLGSPFIQQIQENYNVQVMLRTRPKLHATMLVVKGVQWEVQATMEATRLLLEHMCGNVASQTLIHMSLDISPMHHQLVLGPQAAQLKLIMQGSGARVMFPDADDPNIPALKKSNVTITGDIASVYRARQQLVGSLPLVVIFDVADEGRNIEQELVNRVMQTHNVFVNVRRKPRQGLVSVVIKGIERCAGDIYEARRELLGGGEPSVTADVPESYRLPPAAAASAAAAFNPFSPSHAAGLPPSPAPPHHHHPLHPQHQYGNYPSPMYNPPTPGGYASPLSPATPQSWAVVPPSPPAQPAPFQYPAQVASAAAAAAASAYGKQGNTWNGGCAMSRVHQQMLLQQFQQQQQAAHQQVSQPNSLSQLLNMSGPGSSGYQSNFTGSSVSLDTHSASGGDCSNVVSPSVSPISNSRSPTHTADTDQSQDLQELLSELSVTVDRRAVGCEKNFFQTIQQKMSPPDYQQMKGEAAKAMQEEVGSGYRLPTTRWSGYYFSHTSPSALKLGDLKRQHSPETAPWNKSEPLTRPNVADGVPAAAATAALPAPLPATPERQAAGGAEAAGGAAAAGSPRARGCVALAELFARAGLHKYIEPFRQHEIDLSTFASLNEHDLTVVGISAFGARRKMLLLIKDLKKQFPSSPEADNNLAAPAQRYVTEAGPTHDQW